MSKPSRQDILDTMAKEIWTRNELAASLQAEPSRIGARVREFIKEGRVEELPGRVTCEITGNTVKAVRRKRIND